MSSYVLKTVNLLLSLTKLMEMWFENVVKGIKAFEQSRGEAMTSRLSIVLWMGVKVARPVGWISQLKQNFML